MSRPRFRRLAHTADVRLAIWGDDEEELLDNAVAGALASALDRPVRRAPLQWHTVERWPEELPDRLVRAVNEALFLLYVRRQVVTGVRLGGASATLGVVPLPEGWSAAAEVKAATFHDLAVVRRPRLRAVLTLDL
jgi:SHS2 domain-containing protein